MEVKRGYLTQGHSAGEWQSHTFNPGLFDSKACSVLCSLAVGRLRCIHQLFSLAARPLGESSVNGPLPMNGLDLRLYSRILGRIEGTLGAAVGIRSPAL